MLLYLELFYVIIVFCAAIVRNKLLIKNAWSLSTTSDLEKEQVTFCRFAAHTGIQVFRPVYIDIWPFFVFDFLEIVHWNTYFNNTR